MLDDGESPMKKEDLVKEGTEMERIDAMEIFENVQKKVKHEIVVFTKAPYREYCEPCMRFSTPCVVEGNQAWDAELNMAYYDNYMSEDMLNTLGYVRLDYKPSIVFGRSFLVTTKSRVDFEIGEMRVDVTMLKEEMDIDTLLINFVEDMDEVGDTSGEFVKMGKANRLKSNNIVLRKIYLAMEKRFIENGAWSFINELVIDPCVLAILKGSFDPVSPFIRQTAELRIAKILVRAFMYRTGSKDKVQKPDIWLLSLLDEGHNANVVWILAEYLSKRALGIKEKSEICGGHFVTKIARRLGFYNERELAKCSESIKSESLDDKMFGKALDRRAKKLSPITPLVAPTQATNLPKGGPSGLNSSWRDWNASLCWYKYYDILSIHSLCVLVMTNM
ncbi:hypothetical protein Tco_0996556 [Tanacetum coccineum]